MNPAEPRRTRRLGLAMIAAVVLLGAVAGPAAGAQTAAEGSASGDTTLVVDLAEDGDATVTLRLAFDLDSEEERRALERLRENQTEIATAFEEQMRAVAARTAEETGREMTVASADVAISTEGSTGVVELSVMWSDLAAVDGNKLVVSQPFADGFESPGRFEVRAPEGYVLAESTPTATTSTETTAAWKAGSSLDGFEAAFVPADASTSTSLPGFGASAALVAVALVAGAAALLTRRRP